MWNRRKFLEISAKTTALLAMAAHSPGKAFSALLNEGETPEERDARLNGKWQTLYVTLMIGPGYPKVPDKHNLAEVLESFKFGNAWGLYTEVKDMTFTRSYYEGNETTRKYGETLMPSGLVNVWFAQCR